MNTRLLLHSTTGNTRLVARYAAAQFKARGHAVKTHDIVGRPEPTSLDDVDLLWVACPTMYFRPTLAMERFIARLPPLPPGEQRPAWLLGTCMGEPGAHFALLAEQLAYKGWIAVAAHWVLSPSNYPTHLAACAPLQFAAGLRPRLDGLSRKLRMLWWSIWPSGDPDELDRRGLDQALDALERQLSDPDLDAAPQPDDLNHGIPTCNATGRLFPKHLVDAMVGIRIHPEPCTACGTCVKLCPVSIITQDDEDAVPRVGTGCTGCFACYNHCDDHAISAIATPAKVGRYHGPTDAMRRLFRT